MNARKVMAVTLATAMVVGSSMTVFADDANMTGTGGVEGYVNTDVSNVVFPTQDAFTFTIDPQGLIAATGADRYSNATYDEGATLLFANTTTTTDGDGNTTTAVTGYSSKSDTYTVTNKSSKGVKISVNATMTGLSYTDTNGTEDDTSDDATYTIGISDTSTFADDTPAIYMALADESGEVALSSTEATATLAGSASAAPDGAYKVVYSDSKYSYELDSSFAGEFDTYDFYITGASNADANWTNYTKVTPSLAVTWSAVLVEESAPSITPSTATVTSSTGALEFTLDLGTTATEISSVTYVNASGATKTCTESTDYTYANGTFTLTASAVSVFYNSSNTSRTYTITFDNNETVTIVLSK